MALRIFDRVKQVTSSTGTGNITLGGTPNGFQSFSDVFTSGDTTYICIENGANWEVSRATYGVDGSGTLSRDTILDSSTGSAINLSGRSTVFCTVPAAKYAYLDPSGEINLSLGGLSDVTISAPATGNILSYNGSQWVNSTPDPGYSDEQAQDAVGSILGSGTDIVLSYNDATPAITGTLTNTTVTPGSYTLASITVDQKGRVTAASSGSVDLSAYLTSAAAASTYLPLSGGILTSPSAASVPLSIVGAASQSAYLLDLKDSSNTSMLGISISSSNPRVSFVANPSYSVEASLYGYAWYFTGVGGANYAGFQTVYGPNQLSLASTTSLSWSSGTNARNAGDLHLVRDAANTLGQQNGTNAQALRIYNTHSSSTSFENLQFKANAGAAYQIGSAIGSAGGTNRAIRFGHWNSGGTFVGTAGITNAGTYGGRFSDDGGLGNGAEQFGQSTTTCIEGLAVGGYATAGIQYATAIGKSSYAGYFCTSLGRCAGTNGTSGGFPGAHGFNYCIVISDGFDFVPPTAHSQLLIAGLWTEAYFGKKVTHATPLDVRFNATGGSGTNIAGASFTLAGGKGTGTGLGGSLIFQTAPAGSSGTSANSLVTRLTIDSTGASTFAGDLLFTDATFDIGKSGATRPRDGFFSRNITAGDLVYASSSISGQTSFFGYSTGAGSLIVGNSSGSPILFWLNQTGAVLRTTGFEVPGGSYIGWQSLSFLHSTSANIIEQRNSTSAQTFRLAETYTSSTSFGALQIQANAGAAYQIGSAIGSAGGTNREVQFGHWNSAGTFTPTLYVGTAGRIGIGTSPANYRWLDITGSETTGNGVQVFITNTSTDGYSAASLSFRTGASGVGGNVSGFATNFPNYGITNGLNIRGSIATDNIAFATGSALLAGSGTAARLFIASGGNIGINTQSPSSLFDVVQLVSTTGSPTAFTLAGGAHTTLTASTEATDINFNLARTVQFATGALTTQRAFRIQAPTYAFVAASTITTASTLSISGPPTAGTNATITNAYALEISSGRIGFTGGGFGSGGIYFNGAGAYYAPHISTGSNQLVIAAQSQVNWIFSNSQYMQFYNGNIATTGSIELGGSTSGTGDVILLRDAANVFAQRNSTNAQTLRVYNTYSSSTSGEWAEFNWQTTSNVLRIGTNKGSAGGSARDVAITHGGSVVANFLADRFYLGPIADNTATGGNARGANSVDLQMVRGSANQVASGPNSVILGGSSNRVANGYGYAGVVVGNSNTVTGANAVIVAGNACTASGVYSTIVNGNTNVASAEGSFIGGGIYNTASGLYSFVGGGAGNTASASYASILGGGTAVANRYGMRAFAAGSFAANGDVQNVDFILRRKTTDATPTALMLDGSSTRLTITSGKILFADVLVAGIKSDGSASACYKRKVAIKNVGGTTSLVGTVEAIGTDIEDNVLTDVAITADNTNDALDISVTGIAGETWRWVAVVEGLEIAYGT